MAIDLPSPWSLFDYYFQRIDVQFIEEIQAHCIRMTGVLHLESIKCFFVYLEKIFCIFNIVFHNRYKSELKLGLRQVIQNARRLSNNQSSHTDSFVVYTKN